METSPVSLRAAEADRDLVEIGGRTSRSRRWAGKEVPHAALCFVAFAIPIAAYIWMIHSYSVNVIYADQWDDLALLRHSYDGSLGLNTLWAQHNENRIFFPNLIVLVLGHMFHFNIVYEEYLMGAILIASVALLIWAHKRWAERPLIFYAPVAVVLLSLGQHGNALWGFQLAWYMILLSFAATVVAIDRKVLTWPFFLIAVAAAVIGSYSSLQGLLIWPACLLLIVWRRRARSFLLAWIGCAAVTTTFYFYNFNFHLANSRLGALFALKHPVDAVKFVVFSVGDVLGVDMTSKTKQIGLVGVGNVWVFLFGLALIGMSATAVVMAIRRGRSGGSPVGVTLVCFGFLFALLVTQGRLWGGYYLASASRYTTFNLLILAGIYLVAIDRRKEAERRDGDFVGRAVSQQVLAAPGRGRYVLGVAVGVAIVLQLVMGSWNGVVGARDDRQVRLDAVDTLLHHEKDLNHLNTWALDPFAPAPYIQSLARFAEQEKLSLFWRR